MRIKCLAQGNNILLPGFEPSTSASQTDILANRPICSKSAICDLVYFDDNIKLSATTDKRKAELLALLLLLLSTPLHQRAASRVQHPNHVAANSLSPQVARKGSTLSGFVQRSRLEREVGRDLHSNKWEEV